MHRNLQTQIVIIMIIGSARWPAITSGECLSYEASADLPLSPRLCSSESAKFSQRWRRSSTAVGLSDERERNQKNAAIPTPTKSPAVMSGMVRDLAVFSLLDSMAMAFLALFFPSAAFPMLCRVKDAHSW